MAEHTNRFVGNRKWAVAAVCGISLFMGGNRVQAAELELVYNGSFNTQDALNLASQGTPTYFSGETSFTINAFFDTSSTNYAPPGSVAPPFAGFRAFAPSLATLTVDGMTYTIDPITTDPTAGITVAIFDNNSFTPGRYGVGILQNPPADGAGIIGDFSGATPGFSGTVAGPTEFTGFNGVGYGSGVCLNGTGGNCKQNAVTPLILTNGGQTFDLTLGNYSADYGTVEPGDIAGPDNSACLLAAPEPATYGLGLLSLGLLAAFRRRRS